MSIFARKAEPKIDNPVDYPRDNDDQDELLWPLVATVINLEGLSEHDQALAAEAYHGEIRTSHPGRSRLF